MADEDICWLLLFIWSFYGQVKQRIYTVQSRWRVSPGRLCVWSSASCNSAAGMSKWSDSGGSGGVCLISKRGPCLMWQTSKQGSCCVWLNDLIGMFVCLCVCVFSRGTRLLSPVEVSVCFLNGWINWPLPLISNSKSLLPAFRFENAMKCQLHSIFNIDRYSKTICFTGWFQSIIYY